MSAPVAYSIIGLLTYVLTFFASSFRFKEDIQFHRAVYTICFITFCIIDAITLLRTH